MIDFALLLHATQWKMKLISFYFTLYSLIYHTALINLSLSLANLVVKITKRIADEIYSMV